MVKITDKSNYSRFARPAAQDEGIWLDHVEVHLVTHPAGQEPTGRAARLIDAAFAADGLLWSSPFDQGTISGSLKNALDWLHVLGNREPPYLHDKVIGLISAAGGTQGLQAINTMEFAVRALRGWAVPFVVPVAAAARVFNREGRIREPTVGLQLKTLGEEVVRAARRFSSESKF